MRFVDLLGLAIWALFRQKVRTLLATLGVLFGSFVLVASLSIREGVHETIAHEYSRHGELRQVMVYSNYGARVDVPAEKLQIRGEMSEAKRQRLRKEIIRRWQGQSKPDPRHLLTRERIEALAALDHVRTVTPVSQQAGYVSLGDKSEHAQVSGAQPGSEDLRGRMVAGEFLDAADGQGAVISEYLLYLLGVVDDAEVERVPGRRLRWEQHARPSPGLLVTLVHGNHRQLSAEEEKLLARVVDRLPDALAKLDLTAEEQATAQRLLRPPEGLKESADVVEEFTIRGVYRAAAPEEEQHGWWPTADADLFVPAQTAARLFERSPFYREMAYPTVRVEVDDLAHVKGVVQEIEAQGFSTHSLAKMVEQEQFIYRLIFSAMTVIAFVSLAVAALGITNTMLMGVLERVREIGIMKAVGGRDGHIQMMFLIEGGLVGLVGGGLGLLLGWVASFPADAWVRATVEQMDSSVRLETSIFIFPGWLLIGVPVFAGAVTTLAAFYPARRAARVNPIAALRHD